MSSTIFLLYLLHIYRADQLAFNAMTSPVWTMANGTLLDPAGIEHRSYSAHAKTNTLFIKLLWTYQTTHIGIQHTKVFLIDWPFPYLFNLFPYRYACTSFVRALDSQPGGFAYFQLNQNLSNGPGVCPISL